MQRPTCVITHFKSLAYSIEVAVEEAMFEVETNKEVFMDYDCPLAALGELGE